MAIKGYRVDVADPATHVWVPFEEILHVSLPAARDRIGDQPEEFYRIVEVRDDGSETTIETSDTETDEDFLDEIDADEQR